MDFAELEDKDGLRFSWNVFPDSRIDCVRLAVPIGCLFSPLKRVRNYASVPYQPVRCKQKSCASILNPFCKVDFASKVWTCPFCLTRNHFPVHYADISAQNLPAEILPSYTTIEYQLEGPKLTNEGTVSSPSFLFLIDTALTGEELDALKQSVGQSILLLPEQSKVGLITFGKNVHVHELNFEDFPKSYVFQGNSVVDPNKFQQYLDLHLDNIINNNNNNNDSPENRFLVPVSDCEFQISSILDDLCPDEWSVKNEERPERCTGSALDVGINLMTALCKNENAHIMLFVGGACTVGPGQVVDIKFKETVRSHHDIQKGKLVWFDKAFKYYEGLSQKAQSIGLVIDLFAACFDQCGLLEMKPMADRTGGIIVLADTFTQNEFQKSLPKVFTRQRLNANANLKDAMEEKEGAGQLGLYFNGQIQVLTSREFKITGGIGQMTSLEQKSHSVSESVVGVGGTNAWYVGGMQEQTTLAFLFEVAQQNIQQNQGHGRQGYLQIVTSFKNAEGALRLRVTTTAKRFVKLEANTKDQIRFGFDQEAAAVLVSRMAVYRCLSNEGSDIMRWLDRLLIRLMQKFALYTNDEPDSFKLPPELCFFPQFMFHLRRSQFIQVFNSSPDETSFYRHMLLIENINNSLVMIQPTLMSYSLTAPPEPAMLDVTSIQPDRILLLDDFFHVTVFLGETVYRWKCDNVQDNPEYAYFKDFLKAPIVEAQQLMEERFPHPIYVETYERGSQSRFLVAKLNPSVTQNTSELSQYNQQPKIFTDDVALGVFMEHLRKLCVTSQK